MNIEIVTLGASELVDGVLVSEASDAVEGEGDPITEAVGSIVQMSQLGVYASPYQADDAGHVEAVVVNGCGGRDVVCIGAMDTRSAGTVGNLQPGDTTVATTHPKSKAQLQLKGEKNQVALVLGDSDGKTMLIQMDGKEDQIQLTAWGMIIKISKSGGIDLNAKDQPVTIQGKTISLVGQVIMGGWAPTSPMLMAPPPGTPAAGVFYGK